MILSYDQVSTRLCALCEKSDDLEEAVKKIWITTMAQQWKRMEEKKILGIGALVVPKQNNSPNSSNSSLGQHGDPVSYKDTTSSCSIKGAIVLYEWVDSIC